MTERYEFELRNVPLTRIQEYWVEAGGTLTGERSAEGVGWRAHLQEMEAVKLFTITVPRDLLIIEGESDAARAIADFMRRKTMRGGG